MQIIFRAASKVAREGEVCKLFVMRDLNFVVGNEEAQLSNEVVVAARIDPVSTEKFSMIATVRYRSQKVFDAVE